MATNKINHKLHSSKKTDEDYFYPAIDYLIDNANFTTGYHERIKMLYRIAEGQMDPGAYTHVTNPVNTKNDELKKFPAKLRNYDIIKPVLELFLGEMGRRPDDATVVAVSADATTKYKEARLNAFRANLAQQFVNELNAGGYPTGVDSQEVPDANEMLKNFDLTYDDERAILGQEALEVLKHDLDFDEKLPLMLYDWLVAGTVITHKDIYLNNVEYTVCDPRYYSRVDRANSGFYEDSSGGVYLQTMSVTELMSRFNEEIENTDATVKGQNGKKLSLLDWVIKKGGNNADTHSVVDIRDGMIDQGDNYSNGILSSDKVNVWLVNWVGLGKVGNLRYIDPVSGQEANIEVDDTYVFDKEAGDIDIVWEWIDCVYQAYRVEKTGYMDIKKIPVQRNEINNNSVAKLAFNGRDRGYRSTDVQSVVNYGLHYQELYNIFHFRFEFMLAKNKDKIMMMPLGLIPRKNGWDEDKWFYWANAHGVGWYDESAPGAMAALQGIKALDMGLGNYMQQMWSYLEGIKNEWWDSIGLNRQRYGDTMATDGKGATEQAVFRSAIITDDMFRQLDKFLEKEYAGLIDYSKVAWKDGKRSNYISSDRSQKYFDIDGTNYPDTEFGIFVKNVQEEREKIERSKSAVQTFNQNSMNAPTALELIDANNMSKVKEIAKKGMEIERAFIQQQQKQAEEAAAQLQQAQSADKAAEGDLKRYVADKQYLATVESAMIQADAKLADIYSDTVGKNQELMEQLGQDSFKRLDDVYANQKSNLDMTKAALEREKLAMQRSNKATDLKIAKENKNRHDK